MPEPQHPTTPSTPQDIDSTLVERRVFQPRQARGLGFEKWHIASLDEYRAQHKRSIEDPEGFWADAAKELAWFAPWSSVLDWKAPDAKWFVGGKLNACYNCVDRHVEAGFAERIAMIWEGEPVGASGGSPEIRRLSYRELMVETSRMANALKAIGVKKGDVVTIYMPMVPELAIAMLACARIGAAHSVIFGGFAPTAITERVIDADSRVIITADGGYRRGEIVPLIKNVDDAVVALANHGHILNHVVVFERTKSLTGDQRFRTGEPRIGQTRYHWWADVRNAASDACPCEQMDSEDMLFLLYTSGSTGKPLSLIHI